MQLEPKPDQIEPIERKKIQIRAKSEKVAEPSPPHLDRAGQGAPVWG